jgi:hypothetical protein
MEIITQAAMVDFASSHPELHHYTNVPGLDGIRKSQPAWAINYRHLNDTKEVKVLEEPLIEALTKRLSPLLEDRQRRSPRVREAIEKTGGGIAEIAADQATRVVGSFYDTLFRSPAPLEIYVTSFCTHVNDPYAKEHGLLSQWRGYGGEGGGYCIVFDTAALIELLQREFEAHYWVIPLNLAQVHYRIADLSVEDVFAPLLIATHKLFSALLDHTEIPEKAIGYFLWAASLLKHQGFREENEARIVATPGTQHDLDALRATYGDMSLPPLKAIRSENGMAGSRQFVALFESLHRELPIRQVIVGPSRNQDKNFTKALELLGRGIEIKRSDTPFIEERPSNHC